MSEPADPALSTPPSGAAPRRVLMPLLALLHVPFGTANGFITVTLGYQMAHAGISTAAIGGVVALSAGMLIWSVLWAPLLDVAFSYRRWFAGASLATGALLAAMGLVPVAAASLPLITALVLALGLLESLLSIAAGGLASRCAPIEAKGQAGGWSQAGSLGGTGLGGGGGLWLATHAHAWIAGAVLGGVCAACALAVRWLAEPAHDHRQDSYVATLRTLVGEVWTLLRTRTGAMAIFLLLLPLGTGAAANLFSAVARDWSASAGLVALATGVLSGLICIPTSLVGGYLGDLWDRKSVYALGGGLMAVCATAMALMARTPLTFVVFTLAYQAAVGIVWGAFGGVIYEAGGDGAAATKCNILNSLCNIPIAGMIAVDGWVQSRWGSPAMLLAEAAIGVAAIALFVVVRVATLPARTTAARLAPAAS